MGDQLCSRRQDKAIISALVSRDCHSTLQQTWWLKTMDIYCLKVLEAGSLESRCWWGRAPPKALGGDSFNLFQLLVLPGILGISL